jgi:hypothetical protein
LTGDVGRGCGDASRALLFSAIRLISNEYAIAPSLGPVRLQEAWVCDPAAEIDALLIHVQQQQAAFGR